MAANELALVGFDGNTFNWLSPQDDMELFTGARLLTKAMYSRSGINNPSFIPEKVDEFQSLYEILFRFKSMVQFCFTRYIRADVSIGDAIAGTGVGNAVYDDLGITWDYLESVLGEDLSFFSDMIFMTVSPAYTGMIFERGLLTTMYNIVDQFQNYFCVTDNLRFDSADELWADNGMTFSGSDASDETNQTEVYNALIDEINDSDNWSRYNDSSDVEFPRNAGARYRTIETIDTPDNYFTFTLIRNGIGRISRSANFGYEARHNSGSTGTYAGNFRGIFPDENTDYKQYLWGIKGDATEYESFGSGINDLEMSLIQTAYTADGYTLRCDSIPFIFNTLPNQVPKDAGMYIGGCRTMNINEERFTDYRT